jgi:hypothetical protein
VIASTSVVAEEDLAKSPSTSPSFLDSTMTIGQAGTSAGGAKWVDRAYD